MREIAHLGKGLRPHHGADRNGIVGIEFLPRLIGREKPVDVFLTRDVNALKGVREDKAVHADHHRKRELFGNPEGLDMHVAGFLVVFSVNLNPAAVALAHRVGMIVPDVDRSADCAVRHGHHNRKPQARSVIDGFHHVKKPLACGGRVGSGACDTRADRHTHRGKFAFDVDVLAVFNLPLAGEVAERFNNMRLRGNRISADHFRAAQRHGLGHALTAFNLFEHRGVTPSS